MLGVIGNKFSIGKETYLPFSAELHYFRIEKRFWSICFERIKRAGFRLIATAVPWNVHQDADKHYDFSGLTDPNNDLVVFLELAREFGFKVILRPGPAVSGQLTNSGLPQFLFNDPRLLARNAQDEEIRLPDDCGVSAGLLPSYLHTNYQFNLRNFLQAFINVTKNYVHPRGPVFMVELDYETSFGRLLDPSSADYNPDVMAEHYVAFLEAKYEEIKKLNSEYKEHNKDFSLVEAPRKFKDLELKDYPKVFDWFRYRQHILNVYLEEVERIFESYSVEPLIFRSLYFRPGDMLPAYNLVPEDRSPFLGSNIFPNGNYLDLAIKSKFLGAEYGFAFASSFVSGTSAVDSATESRMSPVTNSQRRFFLAAGLAAGLNGLNHYMFVDREHWYGAPLHRDGTISDGYELAHNFNIAISKVGLDQMSSTAEIAVVGNRLYSWLCHTKSKKEFTYVPQLINESVMGFCRDLMRLKLNYGVRENREFESMKQYRMLFLPSAEVMAESDQEAIVELAKAGVSIVLCGVMPKYNEHMKDCQILANHFRIKTTVDHRIANVSHKWGGDFATYIYGTIRTTDDSKVKKLANVESKIVGVSSSRFKGNFYLFTFDMASGGNHQKLGFVDNLLQTEKISPYLYCSDPSVDVAFRAGHKKGLLFVVAPPPGELSDGYDVRHKQVIVKADLRRVGLKGAKLKLTDMFADEEAKPLRLEAKDLRDGIPLEISYPDGHIFLVEERYR